MATNDVWNGNGQWAVDSEDWSVGAPPTPAETAEIASGGVTLVTAATVAGLGIDPNATLYVTRPGSLTASVLTNTGGYLDLASSGGDGGGGVTVKTTLTNTGTINIGNSGLTASTTLTAKSLVNTGTINISGETAPSTAHQATLDVTAAAPGLLTGAINLYGDALLAFGSGGFTAVTGTGQLFLQGDVALVSSGGAAGNSGLASLSTNAGNLFLEGDYNGATGGVTVSTKVGLTNVGTFHVDAGNQSGASDVTLGGALYNIGATVIGVGNLSLPTHVTATSLVNIGVMTLEGNTGVSTSRKATLDITGAAPGTLTANLAIYGDAELEFASGGLQQIGPGPSLLLAGGDAQITDAGGTANSALSTLIGNAGTLDFEGDWNGPTGEVVSTTGAFANTGSFIVDTQNDAGDSEIGFGGTFSNLAGGQTLVGNGNLTASTTVSAQGYVNTGTLTITGDVTYQAIDQAALQISADAPDTLTGAVNLSGDALLNFIPPAPAAKSRAQPAETSPSTSFTSIGFNASLSLVGGQACIGVGDSELGGLALNDGVISFQGNVNGSSGGVSLTTMGAFHDVGVLDIDSNYRSGGSDVAFGGALSVAGYLNNNLAVLDIGDGALRAPTMVSASALASSGVLYVVGDSQLQSTDEATLAISGAATTSVTGAWYVRGDALMQFASGSVTTVSYTSMLEVDGSEAQISDSGGAANSALSRLSANYGTLVFRGDSGFGAGGGTFASSVGLANAGTFQVDDYGSDGGTTDSIGGTLANSGTLEIGNGSQSALTTVSAKALANSGSIYLAGNYYGNGEQAVLDVTGAAGFGTAGVLTGYVQLNGDSLLEFASGGIATIGAHATLDIETGTGRQGGYVADAGSLTSNSALTTLSGNFGTLGLAYGAVITTASGTDFTNAGAVNIDNFAGSSGSSALNVGGALTNLGAMTAGGGGAASTVSAASLANYGSITLNTNASVATTLAVSSAASNYGGLNVNGGSVLNTGTFTQFAGTANIGGTLTGSTINAQGGLLRFTTALTSTGTFNIDGGGAMEFDGSAGSTVNFKAATGTLDLGAPSGLSGTIAGYSGNDVIDLLNTAVTGLSYAGHVLTVSGSGGTVAALSFSGSYTASSFTAASDGHGGTNILFGPVVQWNGGSGDWSTGTNWSSPPNSSDDAVIAAPGGYTVSVSKAINVGSVEVIDPNATLNIATSGPTATVGANLVNGGTLYVDANGGQGGSKLNIGGALVDTGTAVIGNGSLDALTTVTAASLFDNGTVYVEGASALSTSDLATLHITGAAPSVLAGSLIVRGDALVEFGSGAINAIASTAQLQIDGVNAHVSIGAAKTNTALKTLSTVAGTLDLEGDTSVGAGGTSVTTTTALANSGNLDLDVYGGEGASSLSIGGVLTNINTVYIGNGALSAATTLTAKGLVDEGAITVQGDTSTSQGNNQAELNITAAAPGELDGRLVVWGDALVQFASGSLTSLGAGAALAMDGGRAQISDAGGAVNSALSKLASNAGSISLNGDSPDGAGGGTVTTTVGLTNTGQLIVDSYGGYGGTTLDIGGTLSNLGGPDGSPGAIVIGNPGLSADTTVQATSLVNQGSINLWGNNSLTPSYQATLDITGAAPSILTGELLIHGDSLVEFGSGGITSIADGAELQLDGVNARLSIGAGASNSALSRLSSIYGTFEMEGDWQTGPGGSAVTTTALANDGVLELDVYPGDGASSLSIGGVLTNAGAVTLGTTNLSASSTVTAKGLVNEGAINLYGNSALSTSNQATLHLTGATSATLAGDLYLHGDALVEFASTGLTSIGAGAQLQVDGKNARLSIGSGTTNSALAGLTSIYGVLDLEGDTGTGAGGSSVTTSGALTNDGALQLDIYGGEGGSSLALGGVLRNAGTLQVGNTGLSASTTLSASGLVNTGTVGLYASSSNASTFTVAGAATNEGAMVVGANATFALGTHAYVQTAGTTTVAGTLQTPTVNDEGGLIDFTSALAGSDTPTALNIYAAGVIEFAAAVSTAHKVTFEDATGDLELAAASSFSGSIDGFSANDVIDLLGAGVTSLSFADHVLTVMNNATTVASLSFTGSYSTASFTAVSDGHGGTDIVDPAHTAAARAASLVQSAAAFGATPIGPVAEPARFALLNLGEMAAPSGHGAGRHVLA